MFRAIHKSWNLAVFAIAMSAMLGIGGCGGGSSGGGVVDENDNGTINEQAATIQSEDDARLGADAAVESSYQAIVEDEVPSVGLPAGITLENESLQDWLVEHSLALADLGLMPSGATYDVAGDCGGNAAVHYNEDFSDYRVVYDNYCTQAYQEQQYIIDGEIEWFGYENFGDENFTGEWGYDFDYTVRYLGETNRYQGRVRCSGSDYANCSYSTNYQGRNGRSYRTENVSVSQSSSGYSVSARVYDQDLGYVDYQASNLVLCEGGYGFSSGSISITDSTGSAVLTVTFSGCQSYTATYNGVAYTINY